MTPPDFGPSPLLDRPDAPMTALFFNLESSVLWPRFQNQLVGGQVTLAQTSGVIPGSAIALPPGAGLPITGDLITFAGNPLNATVSPMFQLGYRFPDGMGEIRLGYRFMDSEGSEITGTKFGAAAQHGRLAVNIVDLEWATREFSLGPDCEMRLAIGVRYNTIYYDSQVTLLNPVTVIDQPFGTSPFTRLSQTEVVNDRLIGFHGLLELDRKFCIPGLTVFGRIEGSGMYGYAYQTFKEVLAERPGFNEIRVRTRLGLPILAGEAGLAYDMPLLNHSRFLIGYQYEVWFNAGRGNNDLSFGELSDQGIFLRAEFNF
jgi:hypothetical protein